MSAAELIESFAEDVLVRRFAPGSYVQGKWVEGPFQDFPARMSIQPLIGKDLLNLPEAQRGKRIMMGYAALELKTVHELSGQSADQVFYDGVWFQVQRVELWKDGSGELDHWKLLLAEVNP